MVDRTHARIVTSAFGVGVVEVEEDRVEKEQ